MVMEQPTASPPSVIAGRFRLEEFLGEGERKRVYRAWDPQFDTDVAVALISTDDPAEVSVTEWEVRVTARLRECPHIVTVYDTGIDGGWSYIVSQYMAGGDLRTRCRELVEDGGAFTIEDALRIAREVCDGLVHSHRLAIVHRDVQPGNVWFDRPDGVAHLGDFDLAVSLEQVEPIPAKLVTTRSYMPPEQVTGELIDERCDLYSFGAMIFELITGRPPFVGSEDEIIQQHVNREPVPPSQLRAETPLSLDVLVSSLLNKIPDERPNSSEEVLEGLDAIAAETTAATFDLDGVIEAQESDHVEFKASLRYSHGDPEIPEKTLEVQVGKTLAAFMNSEGGTLLIGVADDGQILGIEHDYETFTKGNDRDMWERHFRQVMRSMLGLEASSAISLFFVKREDRTVAVAGCKRRSRGTWMEGKDREEFYVRLGNRTEQLSPRQAAGYISDQWPR
jgi:serine/threonine protein kinase